MLLPDLILPTIVPDWNSTRSMDTYLLTGMTNQWQLLSSLLTMTGVLLSLQKSWERMMIIVTSATGH